jgi:hypothetical protein
MDKSTAISTDSKLAKQFAEFESKNRAAFDENGWNLFAEKTIEYYNRLYIYARRECLERNENDVAPHYTGKDVELAAIKIAIRNCSSRRRHRSLLQMGAMSMSILVGVIGNWAFSDITSQHPSALPWCALVIAIVAAMGLFHFQTIEEFNHE